jgi:hypothetical protein
MKRFFIVLFLLAASTFILAQEPKWTVSILPGYTLNAPRGVQKDYDYYFHGQIRTSECVSSRRSVTSLDVTRRLTSSFSLHFAYLYTETTYWDHPHWEYVSEIGPSPGHYHFYEPISILEIGPEWNFSKLGKGDIYLQLNLGKTFDSSYSYSWPMGTAPYSGSYYKHKTRNDKWTIGSAIGIHWPLTDNIGVTAQIACHYLSGWWYSPIWDARAGVAFRLGGGKDIEKPAAATSDDNSTENSDSSSKWTVSLLSGRILNSFDKRTTDDWHYDDIHVKADGSSINSCDIGYKIADRYGLYFSLSRDNSKYDHRYEEHGGDWIENESVRSPITIFEIGPEWQFELGEKSEWYVRFGLGRTINSSGAKVKAEYFSDHHGWHWDKDWRQANVRMNTWTAGTAIGICYFFLENAGIAAQAGMHYLDGWWQSPLWDARAGIVFRF